MKNFNLNSREIVNKYADMIYNISIRYLKNKEDAEDIVQEAFMKYISYIKRRGDFADSEYEKYWLIRVTLNLCNNEINSAKNKKNVPLSYYEISDSDSSENYCLFDVIKSLNTKYRDVFELFYIEDMKVSEISKILSISEASVKTRLKRARDKLRKILYIGGEKENE